MRPSATGTRWRFDNDNLFFTVVPTAHMRTSAFGIHWVAGFKTDTERLGPVRFPHASGAGFIRIETVGSLDTYINSDLRSTKGLSDRD